MILLFHWPDEDYVPRACVLDMRDVSSDMDDTSLPESAVIVYLHKLTPDPIHPIRFLILFILCNCRWPVEHMGIYGYNLGGHLR